MTRTRIAATLLALGLAITGCGGDGEGEPEDQPSSSAPSATDELALQDVADTLSEAHSVGLGEQREGPVDEDDDHPNAPLGRIDTGRVLIYEFKTPEAAGHWADTMSSGSGERPQHSAGRFALSWRTDEVPSSDDYMDTLNAALDELVADHDGA